MPVTDARTVATGSQDGLERHYIAFISYRHMPLDRAAAIRLQRFIERYVVPREYRDKTGGKRLGIVFRDEDELPLSSNLSSDIIRALDHSEYLIVICSPDLPKSQWCEAEIRHFLKTHDRDHLLAVLVDGDPDTSFSPHMLHIVDGEGNIVQDIEPLAANIAGGNHSIDRRVVTKEFTRLCAAIIGCPFDALWQRERRAMLARVIAVLSVGLVILAGFLSMLFFKNREIQSSLMATYVNTAIRAEADGDPSAALAYYAKVLDMQPGNGEARLGALIELQKYDWVYQEALSEEELQAVSIGPDHLDISSRTADVAWDGQSFSVSYEGKTYTCGYDMQISPSIEANENAQETPDSFSLKVCPVSYRGTVYLVAVYGGYVSFYREGETDAEGRNCALTERIDLAGMIEKSDPALQGPGGDPIYITNDYGWNREWCDIYAMRGHRQVIVQAGCASVIFDVTDGGILGCLDFVGIGGQVREFFSPDDEFVVITFDHPNPENEGDAEDLWPRLYVFRSDGEPLIAAKEARKHKIVCGELSENGEGILWAEGRTISLLDRFRGTADSATVNVVNTLAESAFDDSGRILSRDTGGQAARYRAARLRCLVENEYVEQPWLPIQVSGRFRMDADGTVLELLDGAGQAVDSVDLAGYFENEFGLNLIGSPDGDIAYVMGYYQDNFLRISLDDQGAAIAGVESLGITGGRFVEKMDAYPGGVLVAVDGGTVFNYRNSDTEACDAIEVMDIGSFWDLKICGDDLVAIIIDEMDHEHYNVQLWNFRANKYIANLEDSGYDYFSDLDYSDDGILSYYYCSQYLIGMDCEVESEGRRYWRLRGDAPDRRAVGALIDLTSYEIDPDQTLGAKATGFADLGNWSAYFGVEYPYEAPANAG